MSLDSSETYVYMDDISNGQENVRISFINQMNSHSLSKYVSYISSNILISDTLSEDFESFPLPCKCEDSCDSNCSCGLGSDIAYTNGVLSEDYLSDTSKPIVECSTLCTCKNCSNYVVQSGIKICLQVFMTECKGFGVQTLDFIPKLTFVCEYAGELIDKVEAQKRFKKQKREEPNYIFILNEYSSEHSNTCTVIDPTYNGNVGRYLNHSCSPNLIPVPVRANSIVPRICFFAKNDIQPYEELTYNYGTGIQQENLNLSHLEKTVKVVKKKKCYCNSTHCLGALPVDCNLLH